MGNLAFDLDEQAGRDFTLAPGGGGHFNADDVLGGFVYGQMDLASRAALAHCVLTHFSLAFAEDLQAGRIDHHVFTRSYSDQFVTRYLSFTLTFPVSGFTLMAMPHVRGLSNPD